MPFHTPCREGVQICTDSKSSPSTASLSPIPHLLSCRAAVFPPPASYPLSSRLPAFICLYCQTQRQGKITLPPSPNVKQHRRKPPFILPDIGINRTLAAAVFLSNGSRRDTCNAFPQYIRFPDVGINTGMFIIAVSGICLYCPGQFPHGAPCGPPALLQRSLFPLPWE